MRATQWNLALPLLIVAGLVTTLIASWGSSSNPAPTSTPAAALAGNRFGLDLLARLAAGSKGNLFLSPTSIHVALAMTQEGAAGATQSQMRNVLHLSEPALQTVPALLEALKPGPPVELSVANALWGDRAGRFLPQFLDRVKTRYAGSFQQLDFHDRQGASAAINRWVEEQTRGRITNLVAPQMIEPRGLVLANAVYFKGQWKSRFDEGNTHPADFTLQGGSKVKAPFMSHKAHHGYFEDSRVQVLRLAYSGEQVEMVVILPRRAEALSGIEESMTPDTLAVWLDRSREQEVQVQLPRFKLRSEFRLDQTLAAMAMGDAFDVERADFSGMTGRRNLYIGAVAHKSFVDVNEQGTEAAAATGVVMGITSVRPPTPVFRADHPFLFLIREAKSGAILFLGRLADPRG